MISTNVFLLGILTLTLLCGTSQGKHKKRCFYDFTWKGKTYGLIKEKGSYSHGIEACRKWKGKLAVAPLRDSEILKVVSESFDFKKLNYPDLWMGMSDIDSDRSSEFEINPEDKEANSFDVSEKKKNNKPSYCPSYKTSPIGHKKGLGRDYCKKWKMSLCEKRFVNKNDRIANGRCLPAVGNCSYGYATFDGSCNSKLDKFRGIRGRALKRLLPADYSGKTEPRGGRKNSTLPSARAVTIAIRDITSPNSTLINNNLVAYGQLITHDITRSAMGSLLCNCSSNNDEECFNIAIPKGDPMRKEFECMHFTRSKGIASNVNCKAKNVREQENLESAYIDASFVYGSTDAHAEALRAPSSQPGKLLVGNSTSPNDHSLPLESALVGSDQKMDCPAIHKPVGSSCFAAGDVRASEQPLLATLHLAFVRLHNTMVDKLAALNPAWNSEKLYQTARKIMAAIVQQMTYSEFLPPLLGPNVMKLYGLRPTDDGFYYGYNANYDPTIGNGFATAALRLHTLVVDTPTLQSSKYSQVGDIPLPSTYFSNLPITAYDGTGEMLRGGTVDEASKFDLTLVDALTEQLFVAPGFKFGRDLNALNIQRGRDHGIPSYLKYRHFCGLTKDLSDIPKAAQKKLLSVYSNKNDIDLFPGGNAEKPVTGGVVGPTFACLLAYQFRDLRRGDILWYENGGPARKFTQAQIRSIKKMTFARMLCDTSASTKSIQPKAMLPVGTDNQRVKCKSIPALNLKPWKEDAPFGNERYELMYTPWLPVRPSTCGSKLPLAPQIQVLRHASVYRPDAVCNVVQGHQIEKVNHHYRVRFACPVGSVMETDYPSVDAAKEYFTPWTNQCKPSKDTGYDDIEPLSGYDVCRKPVAIQAQTTDGEPCLATGDIFDALSPKHGLVCKGFQQASRKCKDYRVRFVCQKEF